MRRTLFLVVLGLFQTIIFAGTAHAQDGASFTDGFDYPDTKRWRPGDQNLGRGYLDPTNVDAAGGNLRIAIPARTFEGGQVLTNSLHGYGSYAARVRLPNAPGSLTAFFLYKSPDYESEIDIEIFNDASQRVMFTTYTDGGQTRTETMPLGFDPTTGFHVDGRPMTTWDTVIPRTSMHLMVNTWFPTWLHGRKPKKTVYTQVDRTRYVSSAGYETTAP